MARVVCGGFGLLVTFLAAAAAPAQAQELGISINPYAGYYHFDESSFEEAFDRVDLEADPIYGVRLGLGGHSGFSIDLSYGRTGVEGQVVVGGDVEVPEDATITLLYGALDWHLPIPTPLDVFLSGGVGTINYSPEEREGRTDLLVNYGLGATFPIGGLRLRADVKDHVDLCEAPERVDDVDFGACRDDETLQNIELSAGIEIGL